MKAWNFPDDIWQFILDNLKGNSYPAMTKLVNEHFGTNYSVNQMHRQYTKHKLHSGLTGRFENGHISWNTGKNIDYSKMSPESLENLQKIRFKKGHLPWTVLPIGTERMKHGFVYVKVADPNIWKRKQIVVWEKYNGPVPKGHCVIFLNGDRNDFSIENLKLISKAEHLRLNEKHWRFEDRDLQEVAVNTIRLRLKIGELENESKSNRS